MIAACSSWIFLPKWKLTAGYMYYILTYLPSVLCVLVFLWVTQVIIVTYCCLVSVNVRKSVSKFFSHFIPCLQMLSFDKNSLHNLHRDIITKKNVYPCLEGEGGILVLPLLTKLDVVKKRWSFLSFSIHRPLDIINLSLFLHVL